MASPFVCTASWGSFRSYHMQDPVGYLALSVKTGTFVWPAVSSSLPLGVIPLENRQMELVLSKKEIFLEKSYNYLYFY